MELIASNQSLIENAFYILIQKHNLSSRK